MAPPDNLNVQKGAWWGARKSAVHSDLSSTVKYLKRQNRGQREDTRFFMELASNFNVSGNGVENYGWMGKAAGGKMRRNLTASACDTAASLILQNRTVPMCVTRDGDYALSRLAERWTRAIQGQFYQLGVFEVVPDVGMDALQTGTGHILGYVEKDENGKPRPCLERVLPNEILVDCADGQYRTPRSMYRTKLVSREVLIALYPKFAARIRAAGGPDAVDYIDLFLRRDNRADFVSVTEAWHLPTSKGARDGRHVICTDNCDLIDEPYTKAKFPIRTYRYVERRLGYWGQGLVERVMPAQVRLSEIQQAKRDLQRLCSNAYWMVEETSDVAWDDLTNMPGQICTYRGQMPQLVTFSGTPNDLSAEESQIVAEVFENEGFANSVSGGEVNKGLSSARAVRAADDVASRRHVMPTRLYEHLYQDVADLIAELNDECAELDPQYTVTGRYRSGGKSWMKRDLWTDLKLPEGDVEIGVFPISALPTTPAGLWSQLEEMTQAGQVSKSAAMELQGMPDIDQFTTMENSSRDFTTWQIDRLFDGIPELPVPYQDLNEAAVLVTQAMLVALRMEAPEEIVANFDAYLSHVNTLQGAAQPAPAPLAPAALNPSALAAAQMAAANGPAPAGPTPGAMGVAA